ncbi:hypothetical protein CGCF415_v001707 [Colletotrichum fructicola]|nr:hypothetical protein CGCFRS4_v007880 [Colletotrichum fructicola]KAF4915088.1 hypothetical protein CGCF415_v001707 [Colletotrichum fructicola]KAF4935757.1 hypothetical protein CGCF245_v007265 [Colletotrichum fructicola]
MVYYGALSKGCQRCRKRKVKACAILNPTIPQRKCDQQRPGCLKCEKGKTQCPGYRDLADVLFRDERQRIKNRFHKSPEPERDETLLDIQLHDVCTGTDVGLTDFVRTAISSGTISTSLGQTLEDRAANFFFAYYTTTGPPFGDTYQEWLAQTYLEAVPSNVVRAAVQAVGMAAISNVHNAPDVIIQAKERYCQALNATNLALRDPTLVAADSTLMAILLLGLFEARQTVTFENWRDYQTWATHIEGATALLQVRGQEQFSRELGIQLYMQFRNQILQACIQRGARVPAALVEVTTEFESSRLGMRYVNNRPGSLALIGFRIVNLRADIKSQRITDPDAICQIILDIKSDLQAWAALQTHRAYYVTEVIEPRTGTYFNGKRHVYTSVWGAQVWNNWRSLGILANEILLNYVDQQNAYNESLKEAMRFEAFSAIRNLSTDICISTTDLSGSPRASTMIWPLYIVSQEEMNSAAVRSWAADHLHGIKVSLGIKQAAVLADAACPNWREPGLMSSIDIGS